VPRPSSSPGGRWPSPGDGRDWSPANAAWPGQEDDGWGPSTAVYSGSATQGAPPARSSAGNARLGRAFNYPEGRGPDTWQPAGPAPARDQRATRAADRRTEQSIQDLRNRTARAPERGLPWWAALLLLIALAALGGLIDTVGSNQLKGGFNIGIVVASVVAVLAVKRSHMFPVVIAPPIVYSAAAVFQLYVRSSGLHDKKVVLDAAANYLVYGFPAIAAATAAVLIIAGIRLITRK
jgi:Domain of unknown function (DUF6542)